MGDYDCPSAATLVYNSDDLEPPLVRLSSFMSKKPSATAFSNDSHLSGDFPPPGPMPLGVHHQVRSKRERNFVPSSNEGAALRSPPAK